MFLASFSGSLCLSGTGVRAGKLGEGRRERCLFGSHHKSCAGACCAPARPEGPAAVLYQRFFSCCLSGWGATAGDFEGRCARQCFWQVLVAHCAFQGRGSEPESLGKAGGQGVCLAVTARAAQAPAARQHDQKDRQQFHVLFSLVVFRLGRHSRRLW